MLNNESTKCLVISINCDNNFPIIPTKKDNQSFKSNVSYSYQFGAHLKRVSL